MKLSSLALMAVFVSASAMADESMRPIARSGDWIAFAHSETMIAKPDVCVAASMPSGVALRSGEDEIQLRVVDQKWSLPTGVSGSVTISVGVWSKSIDIDDNTDTTISVVLPPDIYAPMFEAMDKASTMLVTVGKAKPINVSLAGSTKVTNAFRTCAGISGGAKSGGANPFE